ncbi:rho GTPase-activating protein 21-B-like isoform X1 [Oscarella lobularis]|uniref:rho GTPase-activating protein 21-B-like isoform X1 n=1 Tax=Oscarella lobularis TaxID=121494 RepID=UPI003313C355
MAAAPKTKHVRIRRHSVYFFGFTLRQCFVDEGRSETFGEGLKKSKHNYVREAVIATVLLRGPADFAGLSVGDGVQKVNGVSVRGKSLCEISELIKNSPEELDLVVLPQVHVPVLQQSADVKVPSFTSSLQRSSSSKRQRNDSNRFSADAVADEPIIRFSIAQATAPAMAQGAFKVRTSRLELKRSALRPRASTPPLVSSPANPPSVATTEQSSAR